ncbi:MAG: BamA/TamA family outer membrane protein [Xanthomonadales bacterium]|nr:patatin-like phospholipase family protein [Gammaproteobacteria bacterium]MBT8053479.1 patatin-like phospholipase family protein [Gammaproteobacteria bacterium]NND55847.1 BamA/TamA family outer membrane protein [Xanthomonadales bacterium]NNK50933.1 BamA/TamA family outer membrane protein [Xanthomonadales bacterium]
MLILRFAAALAVLLLFFPHDLCAEDNAERPKIGLALSGGGARGGAHVGVLKAIEELGLPVDYIAGTSMGAIIGGLYASGHSADQIENILIKTDWNSALKDSPARKNRTMRKKAIEAEFYIPYRIGFNDGKVQLPLGAIEGQHLDQIFNQLFLPVKDEPDFDRFPIPFRALATDLVTGEAVVLANGNLPNAIRASMSVPGVFAPVRIDGRLLVDGGMSNNLPVDIVRSMGADVIIAVDISSPMLTEEQLTSVLSVTEQLTNFLTRRNADRQIALLGPGDVLISPQLGNFSSADFDGAAGIVPLGYEAAILQRTQLAALAGQEKPRQVSPLAKAAAEFKIEFVEIDNRSVLNDSIIRSRLGVEPGDTVNLSNLNKSVDSIYSLDLFESVTYDIVKNEQGEQGLVVSANPRDWGPNYLQLGLELSSDFSAQSDFKLGLAYTRNALNSLGGELRVRASIGREDELSFDFYQPVDLKANWFVEPELFWRRQNYNLWQDDVNIAEFEISGLGFGLDIGRNLSNTDRVKFGYRFARGDADLIQGSLDFPIDDTVKIGELQLDFQHDSLDYLWFPTSGMTHRLRYLYAVDKLGAAFNYHQLSATGSVAWSREKNTFVVSYEGGYSFDDKAPLESWYQLGGLGRLSGLVPNQLTGRQAALARFVYYRRLNQLDLVPAYAGFTLEAGNVWDFGRDIGFDNLRYSASAFLGADTPIGPVYLAFGQSDGGDSAVYFYVGNPFGGNRFD